VTAAAAPVVDRSRAENLDRADPLARFRERFVFADPDVIYLCGNSLGPPSRAGVAAIDGAIAAWSRRLVDGWEDWLDLPSRIGDRMAGPLLGARRGEVIVSDSTSVNLYKLAAAALGAAAPRSVIVADASDFPTDRYVLAALPAALRLISDGGTAAPTAASVAAVLDADVALVCLSHIGYLSGAVADMAAITAVVHDAGALMLWDLSHSVGCYPIDLESAGVDLAVGCTYKYLSAGPGAPALLYVRSEQQRRLRQPIWGWFGQRDQFAMGPDYDPWPDVRQFLVGTPPVLALAGIGGSIDVVAEAGIGAIRAKALALGELAMDLYRAWLPGLGFRLGSPLEGPARGSHVGLRHGDAQRIHRELGAAGRIVTDFRFPDTIRMGLAPLTTRFVDVWDALAALRQLSY
jgi:kynureninase